MRKAAIIFLAFILAFAFCGCNKDNETDNNSTVSLSETEYDLDALLKDGSIPGVPYKLGTDIEQIKKDGGYGDDSEIRSHDETLLITENANTTYISYLTCYFYYENKKPEKGISSIVDFGTPFGFEIGVTIPEEVKSQFKNVTFEERKLTTKQIYFVPMEMNDCIALTYKKDNRRIDFIFQNDILIAVNLVDTVNWSII